MMSTKTQSLNGKLKNPFVGSQCTYSGFSNTFSQYKNSFQDSF